MNTVSGNNDNLVYGIEMPEYPEYVPERDNLFEDAAKLIVSAQMGSTSFIQRRMKLGYNRAGSIMDDLEASGIVGPSQGSKPRLVLYRNIEELEVYLENLRNS